MRIAWSLPDGATWVDGQAVNVAARVADATKAALAREGPPRERTSSVPSRPETVPVSPRGGFCGSTEPPPDGGR